MVSRGAYGEVRVEGDVAVKRQGSSQRGWAEYKLLRRLQDTGVAPVAHMLRVQRAAGFCDLYMERVVGPDLHLVASRRVRVPLALHHVRGAQRALAHMRARGIVHADLKPANVMLCTRSDALKVVDFGISARVGADRAARTLYTPGYKPPEIAHARPDAIVRATAAADAYAMGVTLVQAIGGVARAPKAWWAVAVECERSVADPGVRAALLVMVSRFPEARVLALLRSPP